MRRRRVLDERLPRLRGDRARCDLAILRGRDDQGSEVDEVDPELLRGIVEGPGRGAD